MSIISLKSRHISWENLRERIMMGIPFVHRIPSPNIGAPAVDIRVSENGTELALWIPCVQNGEISVSPLSEIDICLKLTHEGQFIEIKSSVSPLFQEMYNFFVSVSDKIQLNGINPRVALAETLDGWRDLLKTRTILSEEAQLGLRGELIFLRRLILMMGDDALSAWTGPIKQPHDFRFGAVEFEVKATRGATHEHIINGLGQLEPSPAHKLYVLSIRFAPAGANAGTTLSTDIEKTRNSLQPIKQKEFDRILETYFGYRKEHADFYVEKLQLADKPSVIPVDDNCPRITRNLLMELPHRSRIGEIRYRACFEGLGFDSESDEFNAILLHALMID